MQQFLKSVQESCFGRILQTAAITAGGYEKVVQCYISDFIRMTCKFNETDEKKVCKVSDDYSIFAERCFIQNRLKQILSSL